MVSCQGSIQVISRSWLPRYPFNDLVANIIDLCIVRQWEVFENPVRPRPALQSPSWHCATSVACMVMVMESVYPQLSATSWQNLWTVQRTGLWKNSSEAHTKPRPVLLPPACCSTMATSLVAIQPKNIIKIPNTKLKLI